ncbi:MAG: flagellar basal body-associated FliL family protein [Gallionellaceae bacterium]|jgi:flagellar FliL protein
MAKPVKPAAPKKEEVADLPKSNKKLIIIIAVLVTIIAVGGGFAYMKLKDVGHSEEVKVAPAKDPIFIPLDAFTVNLQREEADQYLQITFALKVYEPEIAEKIKAMLPEVRSKLNLLLSGKYPSELATAEGKKKLAAEIVIEANHVLGIQNAPIIPVSAPVSAPVIAPVVISAVASAPAAGEEVPEEEIVDEEEVTDEEIAASAPVAPPPPPVSAPVAPAVPEQKGVVDVLFTSFIIQ